MRVEFFVVSVPAPRVFLRVLWFFSLQKSITSKFQFDLASTDNSPRDWGGGSGGIPYLNIDNCFQLSLFEPFSFIPEATKHGHDEVAQCLLRHGAGWREDGLGDLLCSAVGKLVYNSNRPPSITFIVQ